MTNAQTLATYETLANYEFGSHKGRHFTPFILGYVGLRQLASVKWVTR